MSASPSWWGSSVNLRAKAKAACSAALNCRPVAVEGGDLVLVHAGTEQLRFLVPQAILAVVGARDDPEQRDLEAIVERHARLVLATAAGDAPLRGERRPD